MKKVYLLLLIFTCPLILFCQQNNEIHLDSINTYRWDSETNNWEVGGREVYAYDATGYNIIGNEWDWDCEIGDWYRIYYAFDVIGNLTEEARFIWDSETNDWEWLYPEIIEWDYIFDDKGNIIEVISDNQRFVYTYDLAGNQIEKIQYHRSQETDDWEGAIANLWGENCYDCSDRPYDRYYRYYDCCCYGGRWEYIYDSFGNLIESIWYTWNDRTNNWDNPLSSLFTYDSYGNLINEIGARHASTFFIVAIDSDYKYDSNGNLTEKVVYIKESYSDAWRGGSRDVIEYDAKGNIIEEILYDWDYETNNWIYSRKIVSYWSELATLIGANSEYQKCTIYPNPSFSLLTIETGISGEYKIDITFLNGQLIYSTIIAGTSHQIDLSTFQKGVYFITVRSKDFLTTRKIIKL